jgi:hypothetical protein
MAISLNGSAPLFEVFDMPASFAFYRDAIGFEIVATNKEVDTRRRGEAAQTRAVRHETAVRSRPRWI